MARAGHDDPRVRVVLQLPVGVPVRDSKTPHGPALVFPATGWSSFLSAIKNDDQLA
ncbi:DUF397 domain-containing protein [Streptomyces niveus]|uniref:DUF397 domain-containing protein n=1 Tax=Streptomyces niveus TaxID=193462 RepID=UPI003449DFA1